jgi:large subunit ribosomal protein L30
MAAQKKSTSKSTLAKAKPAAGKSKKIRIQYYRSAIATPVKHKLVVRGLGFTRLNQIVERVDNESIRGMVKTVPHLVRILEN